MQIRLTVTLGPRGSGQGAGDTVGTPGAAPTCDVVVTAPSGTPLSAVTGALVSTAASAAGAQGTGGGSAPSGGADSSSSAPSSLSSSSAHAPSSADSSAPVYVGTERLDPHRQMLGEPPLLDGAVVSLHAPALPTAAPALAAYGSAKARLHVIAGPDAGGIHLLQGGKIHLGRSAEADVPLDDPDVSRLHCAVTVSDGGAVTVFDLDSTNGTSLDGAPVGRQPVLFRPGSTLRVGESVLRVETSSPDDAPAPRKTAAAGAPSRPARLVPGPASDAVRDAVPPSLPTLPDGNGQLRLIAPHGGIPGQAPSPGARDEPGRPAVAGATAGGQPHPASVTPPPPDSAHAYAASGSSPDAPDGPHDATTHGAGFAAQHTRYAEQFTSAQPQPGVPESGSREPERARTRGLSAWA
ncbi:MAG TPA: FHA domain-containing protein, partial [Streptomyces sp.]|nr:FHA domain-containing protein [Streptomyces sp.]